MAVTLPPRNQWIPNVDVLDEIGSGVLDLAGAALDALDLGARYERRLFSHGDEVPVEPSKAYQLTVTCVKVFLGKAGQETFLFPDGVLGYVDQVTGTYHVEISHPWPTRHQGRATVVTEIDAARAGLSRDAWVVLSAFRALALGGATIDTLPPGCQVHVGPMAPKPVEGGQASWECDVQLQLL